MVATHHLQDEFLPPLLPLWNFPKYKVLDFPIRKKPCQRLYHFAYMSPWIYNHFAKGSGVFLPSNSLPRSMIYPSKDKQNNPCRARSKGGHTSPYFWQSNDFCNNFTSSTPNLCTMHFLQTITPPPPLLIFLDPALPYHIITPSQLTLINCKIKYFLSIMHYLITINQAWTNKVCISKLYS